MTEGRIQKSEARRAKSEEALHSIFDLRSLRFSIEHHRSLILLWLGSLVLSSLIFEPLGVWPLSFICLVPWLLMIGLSGRAPRVYFHSYLFGLAFHLINMSWLYESTGWGYLALSIYLAAYFPLVACPVRHLVRRRGWPLALGFPLIWTGSEMVRAVFLSGFPWFFLSHSLHRVLPLIQICDLVGAYGVTFIVASVNGAVTDAILRATRSRLGPEESIGLPRARWARFSWIFPTVLLALATIYGLIQLSRDTTLPGPKIAVIQGDYANTVYLEQAHGHDRASDPQKMRTYLSMIDGAAEAKPDLFLLPETPWIMYLNPEVRDFSAFWRRSFSELQSRAKRYDAVVVTGAATLIRTPFDLLTKERRYNSAMVFYPDGSEPQRYDKIHLVYFGEVLPFRSGRLRFLYFWLNRLMPFSGRSGEFEYSVFPGESFRRFALPVRGGSGGSGARRQTYHFGVPICYEDVMPYVSRAFVARDSDRKGVDILLNISNDGWFGRGIAGMRPQQWQHLAVCVFRAVENRVGIARAVNTGISGFVEPSGRVHDLVEGDPQTPWPGVSGFSVARLGVDSRFTLYSRYGDWFAWSCALAWLVIFVDYWVVRGRRS